VKAWKKGAVIGFLLGLIITIIEIFFFSFAGRGPIYRLLTFILIQSLVGSIIGALIALSFNYYRGRKSKVSLKYPLAGYILFFLIQYFAEIIRVYQVHNSFHASVFYTIIFGWLMVLLAPKSFLINLFGLFFGYLVGHIIENRKENQKKKKEAE
jgi:hypothetical protein